MADIFDDFIQRELERPRPSYTPKEVARILSYNVQTIYRACRDGRIKAFKPLASEHGSWRIPAEELDRLKALRA